MNSSSGVGSSFFEDHKFDISALSSASGSSFNSGVTATVSVGLCGLAGKPNLSMNESEAWIIDPRTPVKKFAALLFKLANVRNQIFKQITREFNEVATIGGGSTTPGGLSASFTTNEHSGEFNTSMSQLSSSLLLGEPSVNDSFTSTSTHESWYTDFVRPLIHTLVEDESVQLVKLGPLNISKQVRSGYKYLGLGDNSKRCTLLIPKFVSRYLLSPNSNVKEMLRHLRRESLLIIVNY